MQMSGRANATAMQQHLAQREGQIRQIAKGERETANTVLRYLFLGQPVGSALVCALEEPAMAFLQSPEDLWAWRPLFLACLDILRLHGMLSSEEYQGLRAALHLDWKAYGDRVGDVGQM